MESNKIWPGTYNTSKAVTSKKLDSNKNLQELEYSSTWKVRIDWESNESHIKYFRRNWKGERTHKNFLENLPSPWTMQLQLATRTRSSESMAWRICFYNFILNTSWGPLVYQGFGFGWYIIRNCVLEPWIIQTGLLEIFLVLVPKGFCTKPNSYIYNWGSISKFVTHF